MGSRARQKFIAEVEAPTLQGSYASVRSNISIAEAIFNFFLRKIKNHKYPFRKHLLYNRIDFKTIIIIKKATAGLYTNNRIKTVSR